MTLDEAQLVRLDRAEAVAQEIYHYSQFDAPHCSQRSKNRSVICAETMIRYTTNELHLRLERIAEQDEEIHRLQFENKTMREALEFYADLENWDPIQTLPGPCCWDNGGIDNGVRARQALRSAYGGAGDEAAVDEEKK